MGNRNRRPGGVAGVFNFSSTRSYFDKANRELVRYEAASSLTDKIDHFANFCVAASSAVDWFRAELTQHERRGGRAFENVKAVFENTNVALAREVGNRFKHGPRVDELQHAKTEILSISFPVVDGNVDLTRPEIQEYLEADVVHLDVGETATLTAETLTIRKIDGTEIDAWTLMVESLAKMNDVFSQVYLPQGSISAGSPVDDNGDP